MPGTGEGKPPAAGRHPPAERLRPAGPAHRGGHRARAPSATASPSSAPTSSTPSTCTTPPSAAVAFVAPVAQLLWAVPLALWADRGSRKVVAAVALLIFCGLRPPDGPGPQRVGLRLPLPGRLGRGRASTTPSTTRTCPTPIRPRAAAGSSAGTTSPTRCRQTVGILIFGYIVTVTHNWRWGLLVALAGIPIGLSPCSPSASRTRGPTSRATSSSPRAWTSTPSRRRPPGCCWARPSPGCCGSGRSTTSWWRWPSSASPAPAPRCSATCTSSDKLAPGHGPAQRGVLHHRPGRLPRAAGGLRGGRPATSGGPPSARWSSPASASPPTAVLYVASLYMPKLWMVVAAPVPGQRGGGPAGHLHLPDPGGHRPARDAHHLLRHVRRLLAGLRGLHRRRAAGRDQRRRRLPTRHRRSPSP